ncbi:MAG: hypothetical protein R3B47_05005 [Bacteroidia bacterium]
MKSQQSNSQTRVDVYQMVTDQMIQALQNGLIPWNKTWENG